MERVIALLYRWLLKMKQAMKHEKSYSGRGDKYAMTWSSSFL